MAPFILGSLGVKSLLRHRSLLGALVFRDFDVAACSWEPCCSELFTSTRSGQPWCSELLTTPLAAGSH
eukprot:4683345-Pyramimonas_sp.AAC.1